MNNRKVYFWARFVMIVIFAFGLSRAFFLTILMGSHYRALAKNNMVGSDIVFPERGIIKDVNGKAMAMNIEHNGKTIRFYPPGEMVSGIVGYIGLPGENDLKNCKDVCPRNILIGKAGLEKQYQNLLMGKSGEIIVEESADGSTKSELMRTEPVPGENITTNIDLGLQKVVYSALKSALEETGKSGSAVVAKVSGEVVSLVSLPGYDPNLFVADGKRSDYGGGFKDVQDMITDTEKKPLYNRVVSGDFAPGSVYKLLPAMAALEERKIQKDTMIVDSGEIVIGNYRFGNWYLDEYGRTEGEINVVTAVARSNDIFFYKIGEALGVDNLVSWSKKVGLGEKTGIDLPSESAGFLPTPLWREKSTGAKWFLGNTYHLSIGQGDLMTTPLQINRMTAVVINGQKCDPRIVGKSECTDAGVGTVGREIVMEGMLKACEKGGTAHPLFDWGGKIYCKTGTAQKGGADTLPNAWISVVVPRGDNRKDWLVITVLIEEGGQGSDIAGPVAREIVGYLMK